MNHSNHSYSIALRLSNLGVLLLEKGCFAQALATFHDAVAMLKASCSEEEETSHHQEAAGSKVQQALDRLTNLEVDLMIHSKTDVLHYEQLGQGNLTISHLLQTPIDEFVCKALMINETTSQMTSRDFDVNSAIILHNFALTHIHLSEEQGSEHLAPVAAKLWRYSSNLLSREVGTTSDPGETCLEDNLFFLWGLLFRNLSTVSTLLGRQRQAAGYWHALSAVLLPVTEDFDLDMAGIFPVAAAAAAAA
jgi:hypothetical protein